VSRLRRPFLSDRYFFVTVRLLRPRVKMTDGDFARLAQAFNRARAWHPFLLTAGVFLPDRWHAICAPQHPLTISLVVKSLKPLAQSCARSALLCGLYLKPRHLLISYSVIVLCNSSFGNDHHPRIPQSYRTTLRYLLRREPP
jgi:REP element-mobilizing transposase RayT